MTLHTHTSATSATHAPVGRWNLRRAKIVAGHDRPASQ